MIILHQYINCLLQNNCDVSFKATKTDSPDFMSYISIEINNKKNKPCCLLFTFEDFNDEQKVVSAIDNIQLNMNFKLENKSNL